MSTRENSGAVPLRNAILGTLAMTWAWGVIAGSVGLNALIKSNQQKSRFRKTIPPPTVITINTNDVFTSGIVLTTVCATIVVICTIYFLLLALSPTRFTRTLRIQGGILAFFATWLFATLVPFTLFVARRSAKITARIGNIQLPDSVIQGAEKEFGTTSVYRQIGYLRLVAILPWFAFLFTVIAAVVQFHAASSNSDSTTHIATPAAANDTNENEKVIDNTDEKAAPGSAA